MKITKETHPALIKIAKHCYPEYKGRKFHLRYKDEIDTTYNANWCDGSKSYYSFVRLDNGSVMNTPDIAPWKRNKDKETVIIPNGCACVTHSMYSGIDCGLTVFLPTSNQIN